MHDEVRQIEHLSGDQTGYHYVHIYRRHDRHHKDDRYDHRAEGQRHDQEDREDGEQRDDIHLMIKPTAHLCVHHRLAYIIMLMHHAGIGQRRECIDERVGLRRFFGQGREHDEQGVILFA